MDAFTILKETTDAEKLHGLTLDMHALLEDQNFAEVVCTNSMVQCKCCRLNIFEQWLSNLFSGKQEQIDQTTLFPVLRTDAFRRMQNVKFLQLNYMKFNGSYEYFPKKLIWLCWHGFSLRSIPMHFCLEKLVVLDLSRSMLVDGWKGKLSLPKLKIIDLRHSLDLIRTPDFSGLPSLEQLILEDCIHLVQIHESIGVLQSLIILNLKNCKSIVELPEEISRLNSLEKLVLNGCSNLEGLKMELEHHQGRGLLQSGGNIVACISCITSLRLKLFFPSSFLARGNCRFSSLSLPHFLKELDLSGTAIRFLPESIKDHNTLICLKLENCKMLQTLPELPSNLCGLDVSFCYSLKRVTSLIPVIRAYGCDQLVDMQDWIKEELIQKADSHMFRILETISVQMQPREFQILLHKGNILSVVIEYGEKDEMLKWFYEEEEKDMWVIQNEFEGYMSLKISSPAAHRICGFNIFTTFSDMSESFRCRRVSLEIRNNNKGIVRVFYPSEMPLRLAENFEFLWLNHWKFGSDDAEFDNGDYVSVSVFTDDPGAEIKRVDVQMLHEEEGDIHSSNEVIESHTCSEVIPSHSRSDDAYVAKAEVASHIFRNYYSTFRFSDDKHDSFSFTFEKK
ncbi:TMV RESISTANCE PROTEIN N-LIKE [Salix viminalis]|uniref:TMV RESISTANCE PROTEIN N-LIKE n=1 Tax=Salix viminalis TaxID=40686 RepID=A0A9Q0U823_SALVM|nr:TMV RESISTANCE PROTEIN N-LIKE [Salix viminalis]